MAYARIAHLSLDGSTNQFDVTFPYINKTHVIVKVDGVATTAFTWLTDTRIQITSTPASGSDVIITRESSPATRLVDYQTGSILSESVLDTDSLQAFYLGQEANDVKELVLNVNDANNQWAGQNKRITNVADPVDAQDAATKNYLETTWLSPSDKTNLTAVSGKLTEIGRLGTADAVADMAIIGTADFVADMNTVASADFVADLNTVASADFVADLNVLATADVVTDMNTLGTAANVTAMDTVAGSITNVNTNATNIASINTNATNIASITGASTQASNAASSATASAASATAAAASAATAAGNAGTQSVDRFNGTGSQTAFTMTASPATENNTSVYISGVYQQKDTYSISGTTLTFSTAPPTGTGNIEVMHMSTLPTGISPTVGTTTTGAAGTNASVSISGHEISFTVPRGDTGATGAAGQDVTAVTVSEVSPGGSPTVSYNSGTGALALGIVTGDTGATGPAGSVAGMADGSAAAPSLAFSADANTGLYRPGDDQLGFTTGGTSRAVIDSSGNFGIGVTTVDTALGTKLHVAGTIRADTGSANANPALVFDHDNFADADANYIMLDRTSEVMRFVVNAAERMRITSSGDIGLGTSSPSYKLHVSGDIYATGNVTAYSSAVAKDNITTIPNALDLVEQLRGVTFDWKESGKKAVGLIYEEVKEVIPELTSEKEGHVGVAYQNTVALLIEAVKTLSEKVKELEAK